jgi:decaprenyl-phosphate phosphoribosyltransferase
VTFRLEDARAPARLLPVSAGWPRPLRWLAAAGQTARPRQWPKNLLVFAAPLAGASLGRDHELGYCLAAVAAFVAASAAVYYVNDVIDADRDRRHPVKRFRPVASGRLPRSHAVVLAALCASTGVAVGAALAEPRLSAVIGLYLVVSMFYTLVGKHIAVLELCFVASGFVLRALAGAIATHVPPSAWFLLVCSLGAVMVATAKRYTELVGLGRNAVAHRPVMRAYSRRALRFGQRAVAGGMVVAYLLWAQAEANPYMRGWHLASALALAAALIRFDKLTGRESSRPVEDLIAKDGVMLYCEMSWLAMFMAGL